MLKKLSDFICVSCVVVILFIPLFYAINEINEATDMQYAEFSLGDN